jgi:hypothetical protein
VSQFIRLDQREERSTSGGHSPGTARTPPDYRHPASLRKCLRDRQERFRVFRSHCPGHEGSLLPATRRH